MNTLRRLQEDFQAYVLQPNNRMNAHIVSTQRLSAKARLAVYADAYRLRLVEVLESHYPGVRALVGDEAFNRLGYAYIDVYPSHHPSVRWFGQHLATFLRDTAPYREDPVLSEMAAFEWTLTLAFDAADGDVVGLTEVAALAAEAWPGMRLQFQPSVHRLDLRRNVPAVWKSIDAGETPDPTEISEWPIAWLLWRQDLKTYFRSLDVDEAWAIDTVMRADCTFADLCAGLCEWIDAQNVAQHAAGLLKRWIVDGLIAHLEIT